MAATPGPAPAATPVRSPLPGFPRFRGVMLVKDGSPASVSRERAISTALKAAKAEGAPGSLKAAETGPTPNCSKGADPGADLCYWGGQVVHAHTVHLIFWEGTPEQKHPIGAPYKALIEKYFEGVRDASSRSSNVYSVGAQYGEESAPGVYKPGEYKVSFEAESDVLSKDTKPLPASGTTAGLCEDAATPNGICVTDTDLQQEITNARAAANLQGNTWGAGLGNVYFVFTPAGVGGCFNGAGEKTSEENACALAPGGYCAYHKSFEPNKETVLYGSIPDSGNVSGCDAFEHPNGEAAEGADGTLDSASHEHNEIITDPLEHGWFDAIGQEVGDKCASPPNTFDPYGVAIGGAPATMVSETEIIPGTLFNQEISGGHYYLQSEWSNRAGEFEGGCAQRMLPTEFTPPAGATATTPAAFNGAASGEAGDPAVYWMWDFGDGMQTGTPEASASHTYARSGNYNVTLTAVDRYGNTNTLTKTVHVGPAPPPPPPPTGPPQIVTNTVTVKEPAPPLTHLGVAELASALGLPGPGATLSGAGSIALGHAACPPACAVTASLYASAPAAKHHKKKTAKQLLIGTVHLTIATKGTGTIAMSLNGTGSKLLHAKHRLTAQLRLSVEDVLGGSWQLTRSLVLSGGGAGAHSKRAR